MDTFTQRRLLKFVADHRARSGTPPTLKDFEQAGFLKDVVETAVKAKFLDVLYVKLTSGSVVKTYRVREGSSD